VGKRGGSFPIAGLKWPDFNSQGRERHAGYDTANYIGDVFQLLKAAGGSRLHGISRDLHQSADWFRAFCFSGAIAARMASRPTNPV
jgi:hypothetical protein